MPRANRLAILAFFICLSSTVTAHAGLLITVGDLSLQAGTDGYVDATISSDSADSLASFFDTFVISGPGLEFATGPGQPDDLQLSNPGYVFPIADSFSAANPPAGIIGGTSFVNDTYSGFDATIDGAGVTVPSTGALLVTLHVVATTAQPGDVFTIDLDSANSSFADPNFNTFSFESVSGQVQIRGGTVIPEPGSLTLAAMGAAMVLGIVARRARRQSRRH